MELEEMRLKRNLNTLFNVKNVDLNQPNNLAAIITAASKMAIPSGIVTEDIAIEQLLDLYKKKEDQEVNAMIGMGPQFVKSNIGYSVEFNDPAAAMVAYQTNSEMYSQLYREILNRYRFNSKDGYVK